MLGRHNELRGKPIQGDNTTRPSGTLQSSTQTTNEGRASWSSLFCKNSKTYLKFQKII